MKKKDIVAREFEKRAHVYEEASWVKDDSFLEDMVCFAELRGDECALEIGVGTGTLAARMGESTGDLIGVDISRAMLEKADTHIPRHHLLCYDIERLSSLFLDESFDFVYCRAVLHHIDVPHTLLELNSLIKPGGKIFITETVAVSDEDEAFLFGFVESLHLGHVEYPTGERLVSMIVDANYKIKKQKIIIERASLNNILASTSISGPEKNNIFSMFREASGQTKRTLNMLLGEGDILFDKRWIMILATKF